MEAKCNDCGSTFDPAVEGIVTGKSAICSECCWRDLDSDTEEEYVLVRYRDTNREAR